MYDKRDPEAPPPRDEHQSESPRGYYQSATQPQSSQPQSQYPSSQQQSSYPQQNPTWWEESQSPYPHQKQQQYQQESGGATKGTDTSRPMATGAGEMDRRGHQNRRDDDQNVINWNKVAKIICAVLLPPLGVFLETGCDSSFVINVLLTLLGYVICIMFLFSLFKCSYCW